MGWFRRASSRTVDGAPPEAASRTDVLAVHRAEDGSQSPRDHITHGSPCGAAPASAAPTRGTNAGRLEVAGIRPTKPVKALIGARVHDAGRQDDGHHSLHRTFKTTLRNAGPPDIRYHDLRHTMRRSRSPRASTRDHHGEARPHEDQPDAEHLRTSCRPRRAASKMGEILTR